MVCFFVILEGFVFFLVLDICVIVIEKEKRCFFGVVVMSMVVGFRFDMYLLCDFG